MKRNIKAYAILAIICIFSMVLSINVYADEVEKNNVNINIMSEKSTYSPIIDCDVKVSYSNKNLYNNEQFLSYHIYDSSNNLLSYEGARIPIKLNEEMKFNIDLSKYINLKSNKEAHIVFDIIDQKQAYWMSTNNNIQLKTENIKYEKNEFKRITNMYKTQFLGNKGIAFLNIIPWICIVLFLIRRKIKMKNKKFE